MKKCFLRLAGTLLLTAVLALQARAEIKFPAIFGDNMVLQQQTDAAFWGSATAGATVTIKTSWNGKSYNARADQNGKWKTKISTPSAGGPYTITVSDGKAITLRNVLIGEVWVCSGQSNMEMPMKGFRNQPVTGSNEIVATSSNSNIRFITIPKAASLTPVDDFNGSWKLCEPENVYEFSATAYFFGRMDFAF